MCSPILLVSASAISDASTHKQSYAAHTPRVPISKSKRILAAFGAAALLVSTAANAQTAHYLGTQATIGTGLSGPAGVAIDARGNLYIADTGNNQIVKETLSGGVYTQSTVVTGLNNPQGLAVDTRGNLYIADTSNNRILLETLSGNAYTETSIGSGFSNPYAVAVDLAGNVYVADSGNNQVVKETLAAGVYTPSTIGSGLNAPQGVSVDSRGTVYIADTSNNRVLIEFLISGTYTDITVGTGLNGPTAAVADASGNIYIADQNNSRVVSETIPTSGIHVSGSYNQATVGFELSSPQGLVLDTRGNVFIADQGYDGIVKFNPAALDFGSAAVLSTSASRTLSFIFDTGGVLGSTSVLTQGTPNLDFLPAPIAGTCAAATAYNVGDTCSVNIAFTPQFSGARSGAVTLNDTSGNVIATGYTHGIGLAPQVVIAPGTISAVATGLGSPTGVTADANGTVYVTDNDNNQVLKETLTSSGYTSSTVGTGLASPYGVAIDGSGNVYIADSGNGQVLKETLSNGVYVQTLVDTGLNFPAGIAVDGSGNVYIADYSDNQVYVETLANGYYRASAIGSGLNKPSGVAVDGRGNVYIADSGNNRVLIETLTVGGTYTQTTVGTGFNVPYAIAVDGNANIYIADQFNNRIVTETLANGVYTQSTVGTGLLQPQGVFVDASGNLYISDNGNNQILKLDLADQQAFSFTNTNVGETSAPQALTFTNIGNAPVTFSTPVAGTNPSIASAFTIASNSSCPQLSVTSAPGTLAAGASCTTQVNFAPTVAGSISGSIITMDNNRNVAAATQTVLLTGTAIALPVPTLTFNVASHVFGSAPFSVAATSNSTATLTYSVLSGPATISGSTVTLTGVGTVVVVATQAASTTYDAGTLQASFTVTQASTLTTLAASASSINPRQTVTLTATVAVPSGGVPAGTVTFSDNGTALSTVALVNGSAAYATTLAPATAHVLTATYSGNANFIASASAAAGTPVTVGALQFTFAGTGASTQTVARGATATYAFTVSPTFGTYAGPLSFTVAGLPTGVTASFTPSSVAASAGTQAVTLTVTVPSNLAQNDLPANPFSRGTAVVAALLLLPALNGRRLRKLLGTRGLAFILLVASLGGAAVLTGCGGTNSPKPVTTSTLTVTAAAGALTQSQTVTLTIQ